MERAIEPMRQRDKNLQPASQSAKSSKMNGFAACVTDAKLKDAHPHDLRRTFGSWLVQAGVGIERVSELLRHNDISIIAGVYAHLRPDDLASAAAILDRPTSAVAVPHLHSDLHSDQQRGRQK